MHSAVNLGGIHISGKNNPSFAREGKVNPWTVDFSKAGSSRKQKNALGWSPKAFLCTDGDVGV
jgi:hypothetical protein